MRLASRSSRPRRALAAVTSLTLAMLAACGGGGGNSDTPPPASPPATTLTISGTAASGAAIGGAVVELECATGTASGTTQQDGRYSLSVSGGTFPCVARVTSTGGSVLYSVALGTGTTAVANITPVTQLIVAGLVGVDPATFYGSFGSASAAALTSAALASAQAAIVATLKAAGIDLTALGDLIAGTLVAQTATAPGNAYDQALDSLASALASSGTTLATLTSAVITASAGVNSPSAIASVPPDLLLQPAAANCAALRSATYRVVTPTAGASLAAQHGVMGIDAAALQVIRADGSTGTWVPNGVCRFSDQSGTYSADIVVTQAGVLVGRQSRDSGASFQNFIGFPEQAHTLAELAGNWNTIGMNRAGSAYVGVAGSATWDAAGVMSAVVNCENDSTWAVDVCANVPQSVIDLFAPLQVDSAGGFDVSDAATHTTSARLFAYRSGGGGLMLVVGSTSGFSVWAPQGSVPLPTVGTASTIWNFDMGAALVSTSNTYEITNTVLSVDTAAKSWTRTQRNLSASYSVVASVFADNPRAGYLHRPSGIVTASDGVTQVRINEFTSLRLPGMGMSPLIILTPTGNLFEFSATQP